MSRFSEIIELAAENAMINMVPTACPSLPRDDRIGAKVVIRDRFPRGAPETP